MRRLSALAFTTALLVGATLASPGAAGTIFATAYDGMNVDFFFQLHPNPGGAGAFVSNFGQLQVGQNGSPDDLPLTAMTGVGGHLIGSGVSGGGTFDYGFHVLPDVDGLGGFETQIGEVTEFAGGIPLTEPVDTLATLGAQAYATSWTGTRNYFYEVSDQADASGLYGDNFGGLTLGEGGREFGYAIDSMGSYGGQLYGTAFDGTQSLFFRINRDDDGAGAWIDGLGVLSVGGGPDTAPIDAMVGGDDGLYGVSWNAANQYNYFFRIDPNADGFGGTESGAGDVASGFGAGKFPFRINTLGYLAGSGMPDIDVPSSAPEPAAWALTIVGFGMSGGILRRRTGRRAL